MGSFEQYIKGYIDINNNVTKDLHKSNTKSIDKDKEINYINNTKKAAKQQSLTTNKKVNTMKNNNTLTNADIINNIYQLTEAVNKILSRLDSLEAKKTVIKPLKGAAEEVKKDIKTVVKKVEPKNKRNPEIIKLQKKAKEMKEKMTKNQLAIYGKLWGKKWQFVNKSVDMNKKEERSMAFAKGRIECAKKAMSLDI